LTGGTTTIGPRLTLGDPGAWAEIASAWRERDYRALHDLVERGLGVPAGAIDDVFEGEDDPDDEAVDAVLLEAFAAAETPTSRLLVAFYVYAACLDKWERSADYERIRRVIRSLDAYAASLQADAEHADSLFGVVVAQANAVRDAMAVESGLNCSCAAETSSCARRVVRQMDGILAKLGTNGNELAELARRDAETHRTYFEAVAKAATVVDGLLDGRGRSPANAPSTIGELDRAERALRGDVYESELRAHRLTITELLAAVDRPRLHVDQAELVYVYPFALDRDRPVDPDELVHAQVVLDAVTSEPIEVHALQVNDLWGQPDRAEYEAGYGGAFIELPPLEVTTTARDAKERTIPFQVEVRLSRLGNHYLRVASELEDAGLHRVNQALRRGSRCMGEEHLESNGRSWRRFIDYATDVIAAVGNALDAKAVGDPRANFHVVLAARTISVHRPGTAPRPADLDDLTQAVGSTLLFHPLPSLASALEEWIRYPAPDVRNLLDQGRYADELVVRTANTTVLYMPSSPEWRTAGYEQMIEFVASVPPLFLVWDRQAIRHAEKLEKMLATVSSGDGDVELSRLHEEEAELRRREAELRQDRAFFHSPALCRDRSHYEFIHSLWKAAGLSLLEADLDQRLAYLSTLQERASTIAAAITEQRRHEEKERQQERASRLEFFLQVAGLVLAVASLAEVMSLINDGVERDRWELIGVETALLVALSVVVVAYILQKLRSQLPRE
jgi:hypothetical protein